MCLGDRKERGGDGAEEGEGDESYEGAGLECGGRVKAVMVVDVAGIGALSNG